jgi:hypothetical protein
MGCSHPSSFFCNKIAATVSKEEKEKIKKSLELLGLISTGASINAFFIWIKGSLGSTVHFTYFPFLSMAVMCFTISMKFGTNLLRKLIFPKKA